MKLFYSTLADVVIYVLAGCVAGSCTGCCPMDAVAKAPDLKEAAHSGGPSPILLYLHVLWKIYSSQNTWI